MNSLKFPICTVLLVTLTACTHLQKPSISSTPLAPAGSDQKYPLKVALVIDTNLSNYTFSFSKMGDTWRYPLGAPLAEYARNVSRHSFQTVIETTNGVSASDSTDVVLQPGIAKMDHASGLLAFQDRTLILRVEWTMRQAGSRNIVWLGTVEGKAAHPAGNLFTGSGNEKKLFQKLFDNLTTNTVRAFNEAPEIKSLVNRRK